MRCPQCRARVPRGALVCPRCDASLSLTHDPDETAYAAPPDPTQQASARRRHRRVALIAALSVIVLALGGWSWWHFTRPAPVDVSNRALTGWSTNAKKAWSITAEEAAGNPCVGCQLWPVSQRGDRFVIAVGTDMAATDTGPLPEMQTRLVSVDSTTGNVQARSTWLKSQQIFQCELSATLLWCPASVVAPTGSNTTDPAPVLIFDAATLTLKHVGQVQVGSYINAMTPIGDDLVVGMLSATGSASYQVSRLGADGRVKWTRTLEGPQPQTGSGFATGLGTSGIFTVAAGRVVVNGFTGTDGKGVALDLASGKESVLPKVVLERVGRAEVTSAGMTQHTFINGHDAGTYTPVQLSSELTTGPRPVVLVNPIGSPDYQENVGLRVNDDSSGETLWTRPTTVPEALCGDKLVIRDPHRIDHTDPNQPLPDYAALPQVMTVVEMRTGAKVSSFRTTQAADLSFFCAGDDRVVAVELGAVRTFDLATGKQLSSVAVGGPFALPIGAGLLVLGARGGSMTLVR